MIAFDSDSSVYLVYKKIIFQRLILKWTLLRIILYVEIVSLRYTCMHIFDDLNWELGFFLSPWSVLNKFSWNYKDFRIDMIDNLLIYSMFFWYVHNWDDILQLDL